MDYLRIRGARTHNLREVDVDIPRNSFVVITGPSGSGKSSLAFDTIFAEGQRRYVESLSPHARQFLGQMAKPDLDSIDGLSPTIAIDQRSTGRNPRSTVGTATDIYDFVRLLFSRAGQPHCPKCGKPINPITVDQMVDRVLDLPVGARFSVQAPAIRGRKGDLSGILKRLKRDGFVRVLIDGDLHDLNDPIQLDARKKHDLDIYVDRLVNEGSIRNRLADSIELALKEASGLVIISPIEGEDMTFTDSHSCADCGVTMGTLEPAAFSFNSPAGACETCGGLGEVLFFDLNRIIPDSNLTLRDDAVAPWARRNAAYYQQLLDAVTTKYQIDPFTKWKDLSESHRDLLLHGTDEEVEFTVMKDNSKLSFKRVFEGIIPNLERRLHEYNRRKKEGGGDSSDFITDEFQRYMGAEPCSACGGSRLKKTSLQVTIGGKNIDDVSHLTISECLEFLFGLDLPGPRAEIADPILREVRNRLGFLEKVGLEYLTMNRPTSSLSGGEAQRIRLATQIGSALVGVTYVLDEPSIGLHQRDNQRLIDTLKSLRNRGNSVIVVEHDADTILAADHLIDMGPGAGIAGGTVVAQGTPAQVKRNNKSLTGKYLSGKRSIFVPTRRRIAGSAAVTITGARTNNLKKITTKIPMGLFVAVTGVSGSGKSSLIVDTLLPAVKHELHRTPGNPAIFDSIKGLHHVDKVIAIDQSPIGRTPRSNPATFTGVFTLIRDHFATLRESRARGYQPGRYSFNVKGGRCEACQGDGLIRIEMNFLPDAFVTCEVCGGRRYNRETLEVKYKGKNIADILDMTCNQTYDFLNNHTKIRQKLATIRQVGLGYLKLGQNAVTLSGGESQRLKLSRELSKKSTGRTLYVLDEPTTGLHFDDVRKLMEVLDRLVEQGNSVVVIEHNLDVIKRADWVIDMGPEGGDGGGKIVATGTPEDIARANTHTGSYLKKALAEARRRK